MKKIYLLLTSILLLLAGVMHAQGFKWANTDAAQKGDGNHTMVVDKDGYIYTTGYFSGVVDFDPSSNILNLDGGSYYSSGGCWGCGGYTYYPVNIFITKSSPDGQLIWAKNFGNSSYNYGKSIAIDSNGDIIVTGTFAGTLDFDPSGGTNNLTSTNGNTDIFVAKYNSNAELIWVKYFGGDNYENTRDIVCDKDNNIILTGEFYYPMSFSSMGGGSLTSNGGYDAFICKLNSTGSLVWAKNIGGKASEYGLNIVTDKDGSVFTTGFFDSDTIDVDPSFTVSNLIRQNDQYVYISKLDADGNHVWAQGVISSNWDLHSLALDKDGNVYFGSSFYNPTTFSSGSSTTYGSRGGVDSYFSKFKNDGSYQWTKTFGGTSHDYIGALRIDSAQKIYVSGYSFSQDTDYDPDSGSTNVGPGNNAQYGYIAKYDSSGHFEWVGKTGVNGREITLSPDTSIIGLSNGGSSNLDVDPGKGVQLVNSSSRLFVKWNTNSLTNEVPHDITLSDTTFYENQETDVTVGLLSTKDSIPTGSYSYKFTSGSGDSDNSLFRIDSMGYLHFNLSADYEVDSLYSIRITSTDQGGLKVDKAFTLKVKDLDDAYVDAIDPKWINQYRNNDFNTDNQLAIDEEGNVYSILTFYNTTDLDPGANTLNFTTNGYRDIAITKVNKSGDLVWAKRFGGSSDDYGLSITLDTFGNIYTAGFIYSASVEFETGNPNSVITNSGNSEAFVLKLNKDGNFKWVRSFSGNSHEEVRTVKTDKKGNVITSGVFYSTADFDPGMNSFPLTSYGDYDIFISKLDSSGSFVWAKQLGGTNYEYPVDMALDPEGNILTTGYFYRTTDFDPGANSFNLTSNATYYNSFVSKLDQNGDFLWAKMITSDYYNYSRSIDADAKGNVIYSITGFGNNGYIDLDPGAGEFKLSTQSEDVILSKLSSSGDFIWAKSFGGMDNESAASVTVDQFGNIYSTGYFYSSPIDFDPDTTKSARHIRKGGTNAFIHKLDSAGNFVWGRQIGDPGSAEGQSIKIEKNDELYVSGYIGGERVDINPGRDLEYAYPNLNGSYFIMKFGINQIDNVNPTDLALSNNHINENVASNSIVGQFTTTDPDTADHDFTYTLVAGTGDADNAAFTIDASGNLKISASPDFETKNVYNIRVSTADNNGGSFEKAFVVYIDNLVDPTINVSKTSISGLLACSGSASPSKGVVISGTELSKNVFVGAPQGFEVSTDSLSGFGGGFFITPGSDSLINDTVYVRVNYSSNTTTPISAAILGQSQEATSPLVMVGGTIYQNPTASVSSLTAVNCYGLSNGAASVSVTGGTGTYQYSWTSGETVSSISNKAIGTFICTVTDSMACQDTAKAVITQPLELTFSNHPTNASVCIGFDTAYYVTTNNATNYQWQVSTGGAFSNISNNAVYSGATTRRLGVKPTLAMSGYSYRCIISQVASCNKTSNAATLTVFDSPQAQTKLDYLAPFCNNAESFVVKGGYPTGGYYTFNDQIVTTIKPSAYAPNTYILKYNFQDVNGCKSNTFQNVTIKRVTTPTLSHQPSICENASPYTLAGGSPAGGIYSGEAVTDGKFNPAGLSGTINITYSYTNQSACTGTVTKSITILEAPSIMPAQPLVICKNAAPVTLTTPLSNGQSVSYSGPGVIGNTFTPSVAGIGNHKYVVTFTNSNQCSATDTVSVKVKLVPNAVLTAVSPVCKNGEPITLSGTPLGGTYSGDGVINGLFYPSEVSVGNHNISYTYTSNGCTDTATISVAVLAVPSSKLISTDSVICGTDSVKLMAQQASSYQWYFDGEPINGATSQVYYATTAGSYSVESGNGNCAALSSSVYIYDKSIITPVIGYNGTPSFCPQSSVELSTGSYASYQWFLNGQAISGATQQTYSAGTAGSYSVMVSNGGCSATSATVDVNGTSPVIVSTNHTPKLCEGENITMTAPSAATYQWIKDGTNLQGETNKSYTTNIAGSYKVTVTDANGCSLTSPAVVVVVNARPTVEILSSKEPVCKGDTTTLTSATTFVTYRWKLNGNSIVGGTQSSYSAKVSGSYQLLVSDDNGCYNTSAPREIIFHAIPVASISPSEDLDICSGDTAVFEATSGMSEYQWMKDNTILQGETASMLGTTSEGNYSVRISTEFGCSATSASVFVTVKELPTAAEITLEGAQLQANTTEACQWFLNGAAIEGATEPVFTPVSNGIYTVRTTSDGGCSVFSNEFELTKVSVGENQANSGFSIYPNPVGNEFHITTKSNGSYRVFDATGREVISGKIISGINTIKSTELAAGVYQLQLSSGNYNETIRIVK